MGVHIGKIIRKELSRQKRSVSWFARGINCERSNIYSIFKRDTIDCALLFKISILLDRDFFEIYSRETQKELNAVEKIIKDIYPDEETAVCEDVCEDLMPACENI